MVKITIMKTDTLYFLIYLFCHTFFIDRSFHSTNCTASLPPD